MDQREAVRISVQLPARLAREGDGGEPADSLAPGDVEGRVEDLSRHGLFVRTAVPLVLGAIVTVCLELPLQQHVRLRARVVRVETGARVGLALRFVPAQAERRPLVNFLLQQSHARAHRAALNGDDVG